MIRTFMAIIAMRQWEDVMLLARQVESQVEGFRGCLLQT